MRGAMETDGRLRMRGLVDQLDLSVFVFLSAVKVLHALKRLGLHPREDGFRRATRAFFRAERAQPCMAAFGVSIPPGNSSATQLGSGSHTRDRLSDQLRRFLSTRSEMRNSLKWGKHLPRIVPRGPVDVVLASFSDQGALTSLHAYFDPVIAPVDPAGTKARAASRQVVFAYNETRDAAEQRRPVLLREQLAGLARTQGRTRALSDPGIGAFVERLLNATWLCFEELSCSPDEPAVADPAARVALPDFTRRRGPGLGGLVVLARLHPAGDAVDLWFHFDHALFDGVPFAEMISSLEREWGVPRPLVLPRRNAMVGLRSKVPCSSLGNGDSFVTQDFFDFQPLVQLRKGLSKRFAEKMEGEPLSMVGLLVWGLAQRQPFRDLTFHVVIDVPAAESRERTIGIVSIRPSTFFNREDPQLGFIAFQRRLSRMIASTRERRSGQYELVDTLAVMPAELYPLALTIFGRGIREVFGTFGVSVIRNTAVVNAAQTDVQTDGFLGFGRFDLPTEDGRLLGAANAKGPVAKLDAYLDAVRVVAAGDIGLPGIVPSSSGASGE
jgi:hypothetical protein